MLVNVKLFDNGCVPKKQRDGDVCYDCYSAENLVVRNGERSLVRLGFGMSLPFGYEGVIRPRSGLSKKGIDECIGTIDTNYRGEVMANIVNNSGEDFTISIGDRICQLAIRKTTENIAFEVVDKLDDTIRGENGFCSSGV